MRCPICDSENVEIKTVQEYQGESPHGGMVDIPVEYICNDCGHKESL